MHQVLHSILLCTALFALATASVTPNIIFISDASAPQNNQTLFTIQHSMDKAFQLGVITSNQFDPAAVTNIALAEVSGDSLAAMVAQIRSISEPYFVINNVKDSSVGIVLGQANVRRNLLFFCPVRKTGAY